MDIEMPPHVPARPIDGKYTEADKAALDEFIAWFDRFNEKVLSIVGKDGKKQA